MAIATLRLFELAPGFIAVVLSDSSFQKMSWRQWLVLMGIFVSYLLFGGGVFMTVEGPLEEINIQQLRDIQRRIYGCFIGSL